jgi:CRP-like cAMP-binding protein
MSHPLSSISRNGLLRALPSRDLERLHPLLEPVSLSVGDVLVEPNEPIGYVHFMEQGIASVVAITQAERRIEVATIGREGMTGVPVILDIDRSPHRTFIQVAGSALRMRAEDLREVMEKSPSLRNLLLRYAHTVAIQTGHTALANGRFTLTERLARWILMSHDRLDTNDIPLTHDFLALMLGVRRPGVTTALHILEGEHMIRSTRGCITVCDRSKLERLAGDSYGVPEAEYRRVIGSDIHPRRRFPAWQATAHPRITSVQ